LRAERLLQAGRVLREPQEEALLQDGEANMRRHVLRTVPEVCFGETVVLLRQERDAMPDEERPRLLFARGEVL
jgi:hypothetical protein